VLGTIYFAHFPPTPIHHDDRLSYIALLVTADRLIPMVGLGPQDVWQLHGAAQIVGAVFTVLGWILGIAIAAAATRTLTRN
jgi:hypothetical protein